MYPGGEVAGGVMMTWIVDRHASSPGLQDDLVPL
jgi:hypothetical protein